MGSISLSTTRCRDQDGAIWWIREKPIEDSVDKLWKFRLPNKQADIAKHIADPQTREFVFMVYPTIPFSRIDVQNGLFTMSTKFETPHNVVLANQIGDTEAFGKRIIPKDMKKDVIRLLRVLGISAISLQHAGADQIGHMLALKRKCPLGR